MSNILTCPFCGTAAPQVLEVDRGRWSVCCQRCGAIGPDCGTQPAAIVSWNRSLAPTDRGRTAAPDCPLPQPAH